MLKCLCLYVSLCMCVYGRYSVSLCVRDRKKKSKKMIVRVFAREREECERARTRAYLPKGDG